MSIQRNNFDLVLCNRYLTTLWGQLMLWTREPTSLYAGPTSCLPTVAVQPWGFPQRHLCTLCQRRYNEHTVVFQWNTCIGICICKTWNSLLLFIFCIASNKFFMFLNLNIFEMWTVECQWCNSIFVWVYSKWPSCWVHSQTTGSPWCWSEKMAVVKLPSLMTRSVPPTPEKWLRSCPSPYRPTGKGHWKLNGK